MSAITTIGKVISITDRSVVIQCSRLEACGMCNQKEDCSVASVSKLFSKKELISIPKPDDMILEINQLVSLRISEVILVKSVLLLLFVPLFSAVVGALLGFCFDDSNDELYSILGLLFGVICGFLVAYFLSRRLIGLPKYQISSLSDSLYCNK